MLSLELREHPGVKNNVMQNFSLSVSMFLLILRSQFAVCSPSPYRIGFLSDLSTLLSPGERLAG